mmetsp:Transcript_11979/g.17930  ORF Transcript_11979/g.17930 Transcript_11979/m.17930 type:complete len:119 (+) Transcript_11979:492-848(+)
MYVVTCIDLPETVESFASASDIIILLLALPFALGCGRCVSCGPCEHLASPRLASSRAWSFPCEVRPDGARAQPCPVQMCHPNSAASKVVKLTKVRSAGVRLVLQCCQPSCPQPILAEN